MVKHVLVAGAGASGLMAAITAARSGAKVTILEAAGPPWPQAPCDWKWAL